MHTENTRSSIEFVFRSFLLSRSMKSLLLALVIASVLGVVHECFSQEIDQDKTEPRVEEALSSRSRFSSAGYDFDVKFSELIWPKDLPEDPLDSLVFFVREVLTLIQKKQYEEATAKAEETLRKTLDDKAPWKIQDEPGDKEFEWKMYGEGMQVNRAMQLLGFAYEMQGRYRAAFQTYSVLYCSNPRLMKWTQARIYYESEHYREAYGGVCNVLKNEYYYITPESVDRTIEKVKAAEEGFYFKEQVKEKNHGVIPEAERDQLPIRYFKVGIPTGMNEFYELDREVLELYRIRNWCVRFMQPDFNYSYSNVDFPTSADEYWRMTAKTRELYAQFVKFMESEYEKRLEENQNSSQRQRHSIQSEEAVINLLRKMLELPY